MWKCSRGCSDKKSIFSCQSSTLLKFLDLSMILKAKQWFFFDKHGDNECPKPFDRKFAPGHVNSSRDLAGCPLGRADVTNLVPSCQISPSFSWWFSVPSHASFILHGSSAMWQLTGFLFHREGRGMSGYFVHHRGDRCWHEVDLWPGKDGSWMPITEK